MVGVPQGKSLSSPGADRRSFQGSRGCSQSSCSLSSRSSFLEPSHPQIPQAKNPCLAFHLEQAKRRRVDGWFLSGELDFLFFFALSRENGAKFGFHLLFLRFGVFYGGEYGDMLGTLLTSRRNVCTIFLESLKEFVSLSFQTVVMMCPTWMRIENRTGALNMCWAWYRMGRWELHTPPGVLQTDNPWGKGLKFSGSKPEGLRINKTVCSRLPRRKAALMSRREVRVLKSMVGRVRKRASAWWWRSWLRTINLSKTIKLLI